MKVEITKHQLRAIVEAANTFSAMLGCADDDTEFKMMIKAIDAFLKKNGYKRQYT